ncbi:MAG: hypothetical protein GY856_13550 [bacterium]|nr:hypothetical protein [bacterium]
MSQKAMLIKLNCLILLVGLLAGAGAAGAHQVPSSDLLLPYFEVDIDGYGVTTLFSMVNSSPEPISARVNVYSNWGVEILSTTIDFEGDEVRTVNLGHWIVDGNLLGKTLSKADRDHLQSALSGRRSPKDDLYYADEITFERAVGFVTIRVLGGSRPDVIFGDYFIVDPAQDFAQGDVLVSIDQALGCANVCTRHALRFLEGGGFDGGTELVIWTNRLNQPSDDPFFPEQKKITADILSYEESGEPLAHHSLDVLPLTVVRVSELALAEPFGWFDLITEDASFIAVRHSAQNRFRVGLETFCLPEEGPEPNPGQPRIRIEKSTNGFDADAAPGPTLRIGDSVVWEYVVTNTGGVALRDIVVTDNQGVQVTCPQSALAAGGSMTCNGAGTAVAGQYGNLGTVTGITPDDVEVEDSDPSHYHGEAQQASISIEKSTNGFDADVARGPTVVERDQIIWTYVVTNTGNVTLADVDVTDDQEVEVHCPKTTLAAGEAMTCTGAGFAVVGQYRNVGFVTGKPPSGPPVGDDDPSFYFGESAISIEKSTNGFDADAAPGPTLTIGDPVVWTYVVTNTSNVVLTNVTVTDDQGVAVQCPTTSLAIGESMTCTGEGTAVEGQYGNVGTAVGTPPVGPEVNASDPSHYFGQEPPDEPEISIEKSTNGYDADAAPGPTITAGDPVIWTYVVINTGNVALAGVEVIDDREVAVHCPKNSLVVGEAMTCTGNGTAMVGQYANVGVATGTPPSGPAVSDSDPSHYFGQEPPDEPEILIEKSTNGFDADSAPGPMLTAGDSVNWTYVVTNTGNVSLTNVTVTDDQGVSVQCQKGAQGISLAVGESVTCSGQGTAVLGQYANVGTATGTPPSGPPVSDTDPSHYLGQEPVEPGISIEKSTNGYDADAAPGPTLTVGDSVSWSYVVTNTGNVPLSNVTVTDDQGVSVSCHKSSSQISLAVGESITCTGLGTAVEGQYANVGTATGTPPSGDPVSDTDPSHYYGEQPPQPPGSQGCTPGYWKNHTDSWPPAGLSPGQSVESVFGQASAYPSLGSATLHQALYFHGGSGVEGGARSLLRAAVAAVLNASHAGVGYPRTPAGIVGDVDAALASGSRDTMLDLKDALDSDNNLGCPLN